MNPEGLVQNCSLIGSSLVEGWLELICTTHCNPREINVQSNPPPPKGKPGNEATSGPSVLYANEP